MKRPIETTSLQMIAFAVGTFDFYIKGTNIFTDLPPLFQGLSWHLFILALFVMGIVLYSYSRNNWMGLAGILLFINADFVYWVWHWVWYLEFKFNPPYITPVIYFILLFWLNIMAYLILIIDNELTRYYDLIASTKSKYFNHHCPNCGEKNKITWNWLRSDDGNIWVHECCNCNNVFETKGKINERN